MKLENQVVSIDLAKQLKELGFKQESLFYWCETKLKNCKKRSFHLIDHIVKIEDYPNPSVIEYENYYSAHTVAELGEMLPRGFRSGSMEKDSNYYCRLKEHSEYADTEADARAKMLIYLKENNLI